MIHGGNSDPADWSTRQHLHMIRLTLTLCVMSPDTGSDQETTSKFRTIQSPKHNINLNSMKNCIGRERFIRPWLVSLRERIQIVGLVPMSSCKQTVHLVSKTMCRIQREHGLAAKTKPYDTRSLLRPGWLLRAKASSYGKIDLDTVRYDSRHRKCSGNHGLIPCSTAPEHTQ